MIRRQFLRALVALLICPVVVAAQQGESVPVVGLLITHPPVNDIVVDQFRAGLERFSYVDGKNVRIEVRSALGRLERVPALAAELTQLPVDVIVVVNEVALHAVRNATRDIPIVMIGFIDDPVELGVIDSYSRPGGNITGVFNVNAALSGKRLEILKDTLPGISRVAVLWDSFSKRQVREVQEAAQALDIRLDLIEIRDGDDLGGAFRTANQRNAGAVLMNFSPVLWVHRDRVAAIAIEHQMPTISDMQILAYKGCLLSYGSDPANNWVRGAYFVDRLLKGADPATLPVEQLSKLSLVVNLNTAKALGVSIPQSMLLRADEVVR